MYLYYIQKMTEINIGINIGSQITKFSSGFIPSNKVKYKTNDLQINQLLNDILDRNLPSIIQYKESNRLYGSSTILGYKRYNLSTFNNLSRFIGFIYKLKINDEEEKYFITNNNFNKEEGTFNFYFKEKGIEKAFKIYGDDLVCSFLSKLDEKIKSKLNKNEKQTNSNEKITYIFTIPDYYTFYQKEALQKILKSLNMNLKYPFINESTALTMYYGYLYYKELTNEKIDILFIDVGHSKTSFIISEFTKENFTVKEVENIPFFGGRDLNNKIFEECKKEFEKQNSITLQIDGKVKFKLLEEIEKARKTLTMNTETLIKIDAIMGEIDFEYVITRDSFFNIIKEEVNRFTEIFEKFYNRIKDKYNISKIEVAGGAFKSILQDKITEITNMKISKTLALDECHSLGALLYTLYILQKNQFEDLKNVNSYNMYNLAFSSEKNNNSKIFLKRGDNYKESINLKFGSLNQFNDNLTIYLFYKDNDFNKYFKDENDLLSFTIDIKKMNKYKKEKGLNYEDLNLKIKINQGNEEIAESNDIQAKLTCDNFYFKKGYLKKNYEDNSPFVNENDFQTLIDGYLKKENEFHKMDDDYKNFVEKRTKIENRLRILKNNSKDIKLNKDIRNIEKDIRNSSSIKDLEDIEKRISSIETQSI